MSRNVLRLIHNVIFNIKHYVPQIAAILHACQHHIGRHPYTYIVVLYIYINIQYSRDRRVETVIRVVQI